jgi:ribosomal protein S8
MLAYNIFIAQLKIGLKNNKEFIIIRYSEFVLKLLNLLYKEGYIIGYENKNKYEIKVYLRYIAKSCIINDIQLVSTASRRIYLSYKNIEKIFGKGYNIVVTNSQGLYLYNKINYKYNYLGGEVLFIIK